MASSSSSKPIPPPPGIEYSDDPITTENTEHAISQTTPKPLGPPAVFTANPANPATGPKIRQRKQKRSRPAYANEEHETDHEISLPSSASSAANETDYGETMETPR